MAAIKLRNILVAFITFLISVNSQNINNFQCTSDTIFLQCTELINEDILENPKFNLSISERKGNFNSIDKVENDNNNKIILECIYDTATSTVSTSMIPDDTSTVETSTKETETSTEINLSSTTEKEENIITTTSPRIEIEGIK